MEPTEPQLVQLVPEQLDQVLSAMGLLGEYLDALLAVGVFSALMVGLGAGYLIGRRQGG